jgi:3',5'-cyclic AMP phosphodiesterase CpdA
MSFTIAHLSDPHLGPTPFPRLRELRLKRFMGFVNWKRSRERSTDMAALARLIVDLKAQAPDHVAATGDVANIGLPAEHRRAADWLQALGDPADVSFTPGNHDAYARDSMPSLATAFAPWTAGDDGSTGFPFLRERGEVALIGLSSALPTGPLMATGRLGRRQLEALADLLERTAARGLARVILIHHPPLARAGSPLRRLVDAPAFEAVVARFGAEAILHGHEHRTMVHFLASPAARIEGGRIPVLGVPATAAAARAPSRRGAYHLVRLERAGANWRVTARARGLLPDSGGIGEREAPI